MRERIDRLCVRAWWQRHGCRAGWWRRWKAHGGGDSEVHAQAKGRKSVGELRRVLFRSNWIRRSRIARGLLDRSEPRREPSSRARARARMHAGTNRPALRASLVATARVSRWMVAPLEGSWRRRLRSSRAGQRSEEHTSEL